MNQSERMLKPGSNAEKWVDEMSETGKVVIGPSNRQYIYQFGIPFLIGLAVLFYAYMNSEMEGGAFVIAVIWMTVVLGGVAMYIYRTNRGKQLVIEQRGFTTMDGQYIPWSEIEKADIFRSTRSAPVVRIQVSELVWEEYLSNRSAIGKVLHGFNTAVTRKRGIYLPAQLDADDHDLVELINFFAKNNTGQ